MKRYFPYQTGNISFEILFTPGLSFESGDISMGCNGLSQKTLQFNMKSGEIADTDKIIFGGYSPESPVEVGGIFFKNDCSYDFNGLTARTNLRTEDQDVDFIEVNSYPEGSVQLSRYSILGTDRNTEKSLMYISKNMTIETGIIDILSGMSIFGGKEDLLGIETGYDFYTGIMSQDAINNLSRYDLIVFGRATEVQDFPDHTGWASVSSSIVFLNLAAASGCGVINIGERKTSNLDGSWGITDGGFLKSGIANSYSRRLGEPDFGIDGYETGHLLFTKLSGIFYDYDLYLDGETIIKNENRNFPIVDFLQSGKMGFSGAMPQNGDRLLFNAPTGEEPLDQITTDKWKKVLISAVNDSIYLKTKMDNSG